MIAVSHGCSFGKCLEMELLNTDSRKSKRKGTLQQFLTLYFENSDLLVNGGENRFWSKLARDGPARKYKSKFLRFPYYCFQNNTIRLPDALKPHFHWPVLAPSRNRLILGSRSLKSEYGLKTI